jgi:predicted nucleic acid-binding protein
MVVCADTSFLFSLYGNDVHTPRALAWTGASVFPLTISELAEYELGNSLRFAECRGVLASGRAAIYWARFESDRTAGLATIVICNLARVIATAKRLSATHTLAGGHRGFDILHVAAALEMGAGQFLTFDANQKKLAEAEGLEVPV